MMASPYHHFQQEFEQLKERIKSGCGEIKKHENIQLQSRTLFLEGASTIGQRIEVLKHAGREGHTLRDFLFDHEVKQTHEALGRFLGDMHHEFERISGLISSKLKKTAEDYDAFLKRFDLAIVQLTQAKSPDAIPLSKLKRECVQFRDHNFGFFSFIRDGPEKVSLERYWRMIDSEIQKVSVSREAMLDRQMLDAKNVTHAYNQAYILRNTILQKLAEAKEAHAAADHPREENAAREAGKGIKQLNLLVSGYQKAFEAYKDELAQDHKDGPGITKSVAQMIAWRKEIEKLGRFSA